MNPGTSQTVAITGATGFVGSFLVRKLREFGHPVRALVRNQPQCSGEFSIGDLCCNPDWADCLSGVNTVIHCAAQAQSPTEDSEVARERLYAVNTTIVDELAAACIEHGVSRLIFMSSAKVYGESTSGRGPFRESDLLEPSDDYGKSKLQAEKSLQQYRDKGLEVCAVRMPLVYGPGAKGNFSDLQKIAFSGIPLPFASVRNRRSVLSLLNLTKILDAILRKPVWPFFAINVADPAAISLPSLMRAIGKSRGRRVLMFPCPIIALRAIGVAVGARGKVEKLVSDFELDLGLCRENFSEVELISTSECLSSCK